jgi:hypothetical protein
MIILAILAVVVGIAAAFIGGALTLHALDMDPPPGGRGAEVTISVMIMIAGIALAAWPFFGG